MLGDSHARVVSPSLDTNRWGTLLCIFIIYVCHPCPFRVASKQQQKKITHCFCFHSIFGVFRVVTNGKLKKNLFLLPTLLIHLFFFCSAVDLSRPCYLGILTPEGERCTGSIHCSTVDGGIDCRSRHRCRCCIAQNPRLRVFRFG